MYSVIAIAKRCWGARTKSAVQLLGGVFAVLLLCLPVFSQGSFGRILGTVSDQSGGVVSGAMVSVIDTERGVTRALVTDDAGAYNAPNLTAGNYTVRVEAKGFKRIERQGVALDVGREVRIDLTVQPGEQNQTVTVTESVPLVETTNATLGGTLENADIADLPLNGRDFQNLMGLRPGVVLQPGGGPWTQSTNGVRPDESVWMVEGVYNANFFDSRPVMNMPSPFTDAATILPIDAIQEFNLMENPKAEYGWKPGAVVNVGIKSGTNTLHGSAYAFGRYQAWDARNFFNPVSTASGCLLVTNGQCNKVPAQLKQFGGVVGGPIKKDKLFFFAGYEAVRSFIGFTGQIAVPATVGTDPTLTMPGAINALQAAGIPRSALSEKLGGCTGDPSPASAGVTTVTCNGGTSPGPGGNYFPNSGTSNNFLSTFPTTNISDNGVAKIDYHLNDKNTINGMFFYGHYNAPGEDHPFTDLASTDTVPIRTWSDTASWVYTPNSNVVNEMRFGYDRVTFNFVNLDVGIPANGTGYPINTGVTNPLAGGMPNMVISGFGNQGTPVLGTANNRPQYFTPNPYYDFQDSVSVLKGKHSFKFGGEFTHIEADGAIYVGGRGQFNFFGGVAASGSSPLEDFFAGTPTNGQLLNGDPTRTLTWMNTAGYIQDDWRVTPKVIINLGLRYEYVTPERDARNNLGNFDPNIGMVQQTGSTSIYNGDHRAFEPRIGFAWDLNGKGTTVVRAGASIIHTSFNLATFLGQFQLDNNGSTSSGSVPTGATIQCATSGAIINNCPTRGGGTISLGAGTFPTSALCWDPTNPIGACPSGQKTVFPVGSGGVSCGDGLGSDASPCDLLAVNPNLRSPYALNYNLSITHSFGSNLSVEIGYVGNRGYRLLSFNDINAAPAGAAYCLNTPLTAAQIADACKTPAAPGGLATQEARPFYAKFPYLGFINFANNNSHSNYNSVQISVTKRMSHGLSFNAGYTYGHGLDNGSLNRFSNSPQNANNLAGEYGSSDFDIRHRVTFTATYNIPGIKGFGQLLEGWQLNGIMNYQTAQPWLAFDAGNNFSGTGENADRWNIFGPGSNFESGKISIPYCSAQKIGATQLPFDALSTTIGAVTSPDVACNTTSIYGAIPESSSFTSAAITGCLANAAPAAGAIPGGGGVGGPLGGSTLVKGGCYVSPNGASFLVPQQAGTFGNMGRNIFRDSGYQNLDFSVFKNFTFKERYGVQFRVEVFNLFNHPIAANPYGASSAVNSGDSLNGGLGFGASGFTPDFAAGNPLIGSGSQRDMQLGLKITF
jgi:hypothetical protein